MPFVFLFWAMDTLCWLIAKQKQMTTNYKLPAKQVLIRKVEMLVQTFCTY